VSAHEPRRPTGPKLPRKKAVAPSDGSAARTARPAVLELLARDGAAQRRKRSAGTFELWHAGERHPGPTKDGQGGRGRGNEEIPRAAPACDEGRQRS
jgi:hypothetical protein